MAKSIKEWPKSERPRLPADAVVAGNDFGTAPDGAVAVFLTQFRDWCFSGELAQLACQAPTLSAAP